MSTSKYDCTLIVYLHKYMYSMGKQKALTGVNSENYNYILRDKYALITYNIRLFTHHPVPPRLEAPFLPTSQEMHHHQ